MARFTVAVAFAALTALVLAVPTPVQPTNGAGTAAPAPEDPMAGIFMNLMKDMIMPQSNDGGGGGGEDKLIKDMFSAVSAIASPPHVGANNKASPVDPMAAIGKLMTAATGGSSSMKNDPMAKMFTSLVQAATSSSVGNATDEDGTDPLISMATTAAKAFVDNMDTSLEEQSGEGNDAPHKHKDNDNIVPLMKLMTKCLQAALTDKAGDPVQAVMNVVLSDPLLSGNPVIKAIKAAVSDKTGDPMNAMIDSLMDNPEMQNDPYVVPILRIAKNVLSHLPKEGDTTDPLLALLNALAPPAVPKNPHAPKQLASPEVSVQAM